MRLLVPITLLLAACGGSAVDEPAVSLTGGELPSGQPISTDLAAGPVADAGVAPDTLALEASVEPDAAPGPPPPPPPPPPPCNPDETFFAGDGACYSTPGMKWMSFEVANQICAGRGAVVASITSEALNQFVFGLLQQVSPLNQQAWIGLRHGAGSFSWLDGQPVGFLNWAPPEPNNESGDEDCVVMWGPGLDAFPDWQGKWNDTSCDTNVDTVICRRDI